ncbi:MAG: hypothetical protein ACYCX4_14720, partial [Bacillota bacterium]
ADPQSMVRLILKGVAGFPLEVSGLRERNSRYFYYLEIEDQMTSLNPELLATWALEPTIRGLFIRRLQMRYEQVASERERQVITRALQNGLANLDQTQQSGTRRFEDS